MAISMQEEQVETTTRSFNKYTITLFIYGLFLFLIAPFQFKGADSFYYWDWSRHLDLAYFDGSPMIAYCIKAATFLFGDTLFSLSIVSMASTGLCCAVLFKTARLFLTKETSFFVMLTWLFSPLVTLDLLKQTTYDNPLSVFWILTTYYIIHYIKYEKTSDIYKIGAAIGLMLLSKYTGVILVLAILIFLVITPYRRLFKNVHVYLAMGLVMFSVSPVLIWNYQHDWVSFQYQLTSHHFLSSSPLLGFCELFLVSVNFMLIPPLWIIVNRTFGNSETKNIIYICLVTCYTLFFFYFFFAMNTRVHGMWFQPFLFTSALLAGVCLQNKLRKILFVYGGISVGILLNGVLFFIAPTNLSYLREIEQLNQTYATFPSTVLTSSWLEARILFFLKNKPMIYTIDCAPWFPQNEYALWSKNILNELRSQPNREFLYVDHTDAQLCLTQRGFHCVSLPSKGLYVYQCHA